MQGAGGSGLSHNIQLAKVHHIIVNINVTGERKIAATETERQRMAAKEVFVDPHSKRLQ